jgi:hypothetical protein
MHGQSGAKVYRDDWNPCMPTTTSSCWSFFSSTRKQWGENYTQANVIGADGKLRG